MKIIEPCFHSDKVFGAVSSRFGHLPRVHIEAEDGAGGISLWHGYDNEGVPIKESIFQNSTELSTLLANNAVKPRGPSRQQELLADLEAVSAKLDPEVKALLQKVISPSAPTDIAPLALITE